jgi:spermidine synthase
VLESLPVTARVVVAELNPVVAAWCRGPLAELTRSAATDSRVTVEIGDVARLIRATASAGGDSRFDAIIMDLYRGPHAGTHHHDDPLYGLRAIQNAKGALNPGGTLAVWGEQYDEGFVKRLESVGFMVTLQRPGRGGYRHALFLARLNPSGKNKSGNGI